MYFLQIHHLVQKYLNYHLYHLYLKNLNFLKFLKKDHHNQIGSVEGILTKLQNGDPFDFGDLASSGTELSATQFGRFCRDVGVMTGKCKDGSSNGFKAIPGSGWGFAELMAKGSSPLCDEFSMFRFREGKFIDESVAAGVAH